ncbi:10632_t:CDS:1 [Gigaspora margarita]|uniref:10632_t:CDS:1 n=1 Tax=Gigaspora margarita TaxID=4874 RepID=A0ABN7WKQ5_GIGMA|nr:10632_t:CDS:1 [Gigaspora margarita]
MGSNSSETYDNLINSPAADNNNFRKIIPHLSFRTMNLNSGLISVLTPVLPNNSEDSAILRERVNLLR